MDINRGFMKNFPSDETAVILATMMYRAEMTRARVSDKTIRLVSGRKRVEGSFRVRLNEDMAELGFVIVPLESGGQAVVKISALEAAKTLTASKVLSELELKDLKRGTLDVDRLRSQLDEGNDEELTE